VPPRNARASLFALEQVGIKLGLDQIRAIVDQIDHPERAFRSVIVAGTNGKGSVTAMIERGLRAAGYRTGRFTSPHLIDLEERFAIDGESVDCDTLEQAAAFVLDAAERLAFPPSFFEATTAMALHLFRDARIDVAVLEVGLGGRLDATNVVDAEAAVITSVDFDHQEYLGHTLEAIAREKAGVIKPGAIVVVGPNRPEVEEIVERTSIDRGARLVRARDGVVADVRLVDGHALLQLTTPAESYGVRVALAGLHQADNAITSIRVLELLRSELDFDIAAGAIATAVEDVVWPARLETVTISSMEVLLDGAHNPAGARALAAHVLDTYRQPLPMVVGAMRDKAIETLLAALSPAASHFVFTAASTRRAAAPMELSSAAARIAPNVSRFIEAEPLGAVARAAAFGSPVVVAGSLYLAGQIRAARS
jgi:dihydrofolate synthase / folylpolyglutamate synthase